ncbi:transporter substrate-binding domain-containing protein [Pseudolactococcus plantarum]|uniref:ABC transporter substrate-binding protein n=1 Tax=Pseudolactococcus plantarum TaxID=1365 RepID=A0A2A5S2J1_9LACT|nr:transporter substrate-binding domain-containing protein [Lactococcus plantarum]PCS07668.1 ABC transporter substrate-binding protein [Lactococcus plantarum]HCN75089.1 amino acid ABC transporter substrate-binding protein [Lactococcus sp.]
MKIKKIVALTTVGLLSIAFLAACGNSSKSGSKASDKVTTVTIAQTADSKPYAYKDGDKLTGFDIEVLKAVDKKLPEYKFDYKTVTDEAILTDIDAGRSQIGANNFGKTPEREKKYLFSSPISENVNAIFSSTKNNYTSIKDLIGKKTEIPAGTNYGAIFEAWNKANPDKKINVTYSERSLTDRLAAVESGQIDFLFASKLAAENFAKQHNITVASNIPDLKDYPTFKTYEYFILDNSQEKLQKAVNKELKALYEDGTLAKLSKTYYGGDYAPSADNYK